MVRSSHSASALLCCHAAWEGQDTHYRGRLLCLSLLTARGSTVRERPVLFVAVATWIAAWPGHKQTAALEDSDRHELVSGQYAKESPSFPRLDVLAYEPIIRRHPPISRPSVITSSSPRGTLSNHRLASSWPLIHSPHSPRMSPL